MRKTPIDGAGFCDECDRMTYLNEFAFGPRANVCLCSGCEEALLELLRDVEVRRG